MATIDHIPSTFSVDDRLRSLDPPANWEPAPAVALARFRDRLAARPRAARPSVWLFAVSTVCLFILVLPGTRAMAQRLWDVVWVGRVEFLRVDVARLPASLTESNIRMVGPNIEVATPREAARDAGFAPRLPSASLVPGAPTLQVFGAWSLAFTVKAEDLRNALQDAGVWDRHIPEAWDGARITLHSNDVVLAGYPDVELLQCRPPALTMPPNFEFGAFTETLLRIVGLGPSEARTFAAKMVAAPGLLVLLGPEDPASIRHVRLRDGDGTLLHEPNADGGFGRTTLVWNAPDRLYVLNASDRYSDDFVIAIADSLR
jgi:hypothetical protein